jgi:ABC-2 type transport system permease protein
MGFLLVVKAELMRSLIIMRRYWFRTLIGLVLSYGMLMMFVLMFVANQDTVTNTLNQQFTDPSKAVNFVLGFIIGMFAFGIVGMFTQGLQGMAATGVLEQLYMSPYGLLTNLLARTVVGAVSTILSSSLMVWLVSLTVKGTLHWDSLAVPLLLVLTFVNLLGFGFLAGGLVLVFKEIGQIAVLVRIGLFALAVFAREELYQSHWSLSAMLHLLPITDAAVCLKYVLVKGQMDDQGVFRSVFLHPCFYGLLVSCCVWLVVGTVAFRLMENYSRHKGTLGVY